MELSEYVRITFRVLQGAKTKIRDNNIPVDRFSQYLYPYSLAGLGIPMLSRFKKVSCRERLPTRSIQSLYGKHIFDLDNATIRSKPIVHGEPVKIELTRGTDSPK